MKFYCQNNKEQLLVKKKEYYRKNREKFNTNYNHRRQNDPRFKLIENLRGRTREAFKTPNAKKINKTFELLGCSQHFLKRWNEFQLYGDMTL